MMQHRNSGGRLLIAALLSLGWAAQAHGTEVYTWTDEDGVLHFSDAPRASGEMRTIEVDEVNEPGTSDASATPDEADAPAEDAGEPVHSAAQQKREEMARLRAERRQSQAETDRMCALHRQRLEQMEPARRVFYTNEQGESVRMDDDLRVGLIDESKAFLADNCD
jgi:flagellar biosynthesis GTPase FlhF